MKSRLYTNWCQDMTSALMSKATMWKSRQSYMRKLGYSISELSLLKNILVLRNVLSFMDGPRIIKPKYLHIHKNNFITRMTSLGQRVGRLAVRFTEKVSNF